MECVIPLATPLSTCISATLAALAVFVLLLALPMLIGLVAASGIGFCSGLALGLRLSG